MTKSYTNKEGSQNKHMFVVKENIKRFGVVLFTTALIFFISFLLFFALNCTEFSNIFGGLGQSSNNIEVANAEDVGTAQNNLSNAKAQLAEANEEYQNAVAQASSLQEKVDKATNDAIEAQNNVIESQKSMNTVARIEYRNGTTLPIFEMLFNSTSFEDLLKNIDYANYIMKRKLDTIIENKSARENFQHTVDELNSAFDDYNAAVSQAQSKKQAAEKVVSDAQASLSAAEAAELKAAQQTHQESQPAAPDPVPAGDWKSGEASAYTGSRTATGDIITESSMAVAIPMSWPNYRSLFGHTVQINLNGKTTFAKINDCGGFGGNRVLDVQPGVYHFYGFDSANAWGVQQVQYRIL